MKFTKVASLRTAEVFQKRLAEIGVTLPFEETVEPAPDSPMAQPIDSNAGAIGNRWAILPMEGWDGTTDGKPTELTVRRWKNFGLSGAKLIWGGEAVAVRHDGRANPNQLVLNDANAASIESLREDLVAEHRAAFGDDNGLCVGLQLTHSGRYARPNDKKKIEPRTAYRHPVLDPRVGVTDDSALLSDDELDQLVDDFIAAAVLAQKTGYAFIDVKHCHGYLGHELLSGFDRPGKYGGDFEGRTRFLRNVVQGVRAAAPGLEMGVRLSLFDISPYKPGDDGIGVPESPGEYRYAFGGDGSNGIDMTETSQFIGLLKELGIQMVCTTCGSPYYNPHIQRPAAFPPSDGYQPPEDPLAGVARQIAAVAEMKKAHPDMILVGSGYTYLQDWLPNVAQAAVRAGMVDTVGLGRMVLSYPDLPADALKGQLLTRKKVCRTFSDCTTAPRNGMVSGCYPLDPFYKDRPERAQLLALAKGD